MKNFCLTAALCWITALANAAFYTVTGTVDNNDAATHGGSGTVGAPFQMSSLRGAIIAANANAGADTITLPAGTYTLTRVGNDANCQNGDLDINGSLTLNGAGTGTTFIQGAANAAFSGSIGDKVIGINQDGTFTNLTVLISGVTIRYGRNTIASGDPTFAYTGSGVDVFLTGTGNSITFSNCVISDNEHVTSYGGGVNVDSGTSGLPGDPAANTVNRGTVSFISCVITNNRTLSTVNVASGGGLNLFSDIHNVVLTNCIIANNHTPTNGISGGGGINMRHSNGGTITVQNCTITNNQAGGVGGGIVVAFNQNITVSGGTISGNTSFGTGGSSGGGGFNYGANILPSGPLTCVLTNVTISGNHADVGVTARGGGVYVNANSPLTIQNCTITGNTSRQGAGIGHVAGALTMTGGVIAGNVASAEGGGLAVTDPFATNNTTSVFVTNNTAASHGGGAYIANGITTFNGLTFRGNAADSDSSGAGDGGGIYRSGGTLTLSGTTTVGGNSAGQGNTAFNGGGIANVGGNLTFSPGEITANRARNNGGGLYTTGGTISLGIPLRGNAADSDTSGAGDGGALFNGGATVTITGNNSIGGFSAGQPNSARNGGAFANSSGSITYTGTGPAGGTILGNSATAGGGAVAISGGAINLSTILIQSNSAATSGGAFLVNNGTLTANYNRIVNNNAASGRGVAQTAGTVSVTNNWWGTNAPAALMSGTVGFTPWLQLTHTPNPNPIFIPNSTTLTATFLTNSAGTFVPVANLPLLLGLPITFNNPVRGSLSGAQTTIQPSGTATATFTAATAGTGSADATVDTGTGTALITIPTGVVSINRLQTTPTNLASVQWTVTFTNAVTNVTVGNFALANTGLTGPNITSVTPAVGMLTNQWIVTVSTGSGSGTLGLNMANGTGVSAVIVNLPFTGQVYTIDLVPPDTALTTQPPSLTNNAAASFSFSGSDVGVGVTGFQCQLDGAGYTNCTSPVVFSGLSNGPHTFNVRAIDGVGNIDASPATATWTVDTIPPTVNCPGDLNVTANGFCPSAVNYAVSVSDNLAVSLAATNPASGSVFPLGTNIVTLSARDTAGNTNLCTFKVIVLPGDAPQLNILRSGTNVVVSWTNLFPCYALQTSPLLASNSWSSHPGPFATNGGNVFATNGIGLTNRFFRLRY